MVHHSKPARLGIGIISAGKVGAVLGAALRACEHTIVGVHAVSEVSQERAAMLLPDVPLLPVEQIAERSELLILAVPDDELPGLITYLASSGSITAGQLLVHTSGRHGTEVFAPATALGAIGLAIHPAMTFTGLSMDLQRLNGTSFAVTGPAPFLPIAQALVVEMGGEPVHVAEADRALYHAALAHASNHLVTILGQSQQMLASIGIEDPAHYMGPLVRAAVDNALASGEGALTGPVARGDAGTVAAHMRALGEYAQGEKTGDITDSYAALAHATAKRAHNRGLLNDEQLGRIESLVVPSANVEYTGVTTIAEFRTAIAQALATAQDALDRAARLEAEQNGTDVQYRTATLGYVPTMGALHDGHATLLRRASEQNDVVVASIFVNPLQFGPGEDYEAYPRTLEADAELAGAAGVNVIFAPSVEEMYPDGDPLIRISSGELGTKFEGTTRPGHFDGVLTVVNKFFNIIRPAAGSHPMYAYFGQKDAQQYILIQRMVRDFNHDVTMRPVAIVRDDNGLALSSRNGYLSDEERESALVLSRTLAMLRENSLNRGFHEIDLAGARERINSTPGVRLDYLELVDPMTFGEPTEDSERVLALVAAYVGPTRLIDNMDLR